MRDAFSYERTAIYRGATGGNTLSRTYEQCAQAWNQEFQIGSLDELIASQLTRKNQRITALDIGSGKGNLFESFFERDAIWGDFQTSHLLKSNPDLSVDMRGLTDIPIGRKEFDEVSLISENSQLSGRNVFYSLTSATPLSRFLDQQQLTPDLIFSTYCAAYLKPRVFKAVMRDAMSALAPGGVMVVSHYAEVTGTNLSIDKSIGNFHPESRIRILREQAKEMVSQKNGQWDDEEAKKFLQDILNRYGYWTQQRGVVGMLATDFFNNLDDHFSSGSYKGALNYLIHGGLSDIQFLFSYNGSKFMRAEKKKVLTEIKDEFMDIEMKVGNDTILVKKFS